MDFATYRHMLNTRHRDEEAREHLTRAKPSEKIELLRELLDEVEYATSAELAARWGITREAVRQMFDADDAPTPLLEVHGHGVWALVEAERYRSLRLQRAGNRGRRRR